MIDLSFARHQLLLNPRMPEAQRERFQRAWREMIESEMQSQVGIATSGSSGDSFGSLIVLSPEALRASAQAVNQRLQITAEDVWFKTLPDFHVGGLGIHVRAALSGSRVVESRALAGGQTPAWQVDEFYHELEASGATLLSLVPTQVFDLLRRGLRAPPKLRAVIVGGGRLSENLLAEGVRLGWPLLVSYGLTECCSQVATALAPGETRLVPLAHVELRIAEGEHVEIRSRALLSAAIRFVGEKAELVRYVEGSWFRTEDCGSIASDGSLAISGRAGDFVKIGGEGVSMGRLEDLLQDLLRRLRAEARFDGDAAVVAVQDERLEAMVLLLATGNILQAEGLRERFNQEVMPFERIREIHLLSELPRSPLGKLLRGSAIKMIGRSSVLNI